MRFLSSVCAVAVTALLSAPAMAAPVDLSDWLAEGAGNWSLEAGNNGVLQTINGEPTVFHNNTNSQGKALAGTIKVKTTADDDFIGFVLGYQKGDLGLGATPDYLLVDWKQADQEFDGISASKGLAISRVTGAPGASSSSAESLNFWGHGGFVTELARGNNLGDTGWADNTEYSFALTFQSTLVEVFVNGVKELSVSGSFNDGAFGFYNYSQQNVRYAGIEETVAPPAPNPVPLPAAAPLLLGALGAIGWLGRRRLAV